MIKNIISTFLVCSIFVVANFKPNDWDDKDKPFFQQRDNISHFVINGVISGSVTILAKDTGFSKTESILIGLATGLAFGILKENMYDKNYSVSDMQSWGIGAILGSISVSFTF
jgi:VanZ family protein